MLIIFLGQLWDIHSAAHIIQHTSQYSQLKYHRAAKKMNEGTNTYLTCHFTFEVGFMI